MRTTKDTERWYPLRPHPTQIALINDNVRFKVVPAGRRSGKTERLKRHIYHQAVLVPGLYFIGAPTYSQVKSIYWEDMKRLCLTSLLPKENVRESELSIKIHSGSVIKLVSFDKPERFEGIAWTGGGIDEVANLKADAWAMHIKPALDTCIPGKPLAWCWLIGVPEGMNHYYDMYLYARDSGDPNWKAYTWHSSDILPADVIESAKRELSPEQFAQEYQAEFINSSGRVYKNFSSANVKDISINSSEPLYWAHDFNFSPMSSAIACVRNENVYFTDEIVLFSSNAQDVAMEFVERYKGHSNKFVFLYGDASGRVGEIHGKSSNYTIIEETLRNNGWRVERNVKSANPAIVDRQNAVRKMILNANGDIRMYVSPRCRYLLKGMNTCTLKDGSSFLEIESDYQHITTAIGYFIDRRFPLNIVSPAHVMPIPTQRPMFTRR